MNRSIISENRRMMATVSAFLTQCPAAITPEMLNEVAACGVSRDEAFAILMAEICGLDAQSEREFFNAYFRSMPRRLSPDAYIADPYRKNISIPGAADGACRLEQLEYAPCEAFVCGDITMDAQGREHVPLGYFAETFRYPALTRDDRVWMTITPMEIETMRPHIARARGKIAVLGLGLGYYAYMAHLKSEVGSITIVESDLQVISLFERHILPQFPGGNKLRIFRGDAFDFVRDDLPREKYDYVFCDLWHDAADGMDMYLRMKKLEALSPGTEFSYWIEETLNCYLRNL
jgi:hypothetical protein